MKNRLSDAHICLVRDFSLPIGMFCCGRSIARSSPINVPSICLVRVLAMMIEGEAAADRRPSELEKLCGYAILDTAEEVSEFHQGTTTPHGVQTVGGLLFIESYLSG